MQSSHVEGSRSVQGFSDQIYAASYRSYAALYSMCGISSRECRVLDQGSLEKSLEKGVWRYHIEAWPWVTDRVAWKESLNRFPITVGSVFVTYVAAPAGAFWHALGMLKNVIFWDKECARAHLVSSITDLKVCYTAFLIDSIVSIGAWFVVTNAVAQATGGLPVSLPALVARGRALLPQWQCAILVVAPLVWRYLTMDHQLCRCSPALFKAVWVQREFGLIRKDGKLLSTNPVLDAEPNRLSANPGRLVREMKECGKGLQTWDKQEVKWRQVVTKLSYACSVVYSGWRLHKRNEDEKPREEIISLTDREIIGYGAATLVMALLAGMRQYT